MNNHLEKLWCALFVSEGWYEIWRLYRNYPLDLPAGLVKRKLALRARAVGIVEFDRTLNKYGTVNQQEIFVYGNTYDFT